MRLNEHTALSTSKLLLVPYSAHHVPTYHDWMQDTELQQLTASAPLTLEEEYEMQTSWRTDGDKLTFIICLAPEPSPSHGPGNSGEAGTETVVGKVHDSPDRMIGDVNLFISEAESEAEDDDGDAAGDGDGDVLVGEVELMIAAKEGRGLGHGRATLVTFLWYVVTNIEAVMGEYAAGKAKGRMEYLRVKIGEGNVRSLSLFQSVGFVKVREESNYFGEFELRMAIGQDAVERLRGSKGFETPLVRGYTIQ